MTPDRRRPRPKSLEHFFEHPKLENVVLELQPRIHQATVLVCESAEGEPTPFLRLVVERYEGEYLQTEFHPDEALQVGQALILSALRKASPWLLASNETAIRLAQRLQ